MTTTRPRTTAALDVAADVVAADAVRLAAQRKVADRAAQLRYLLAHPTEFTKPADDAHRAEYSCLVHIQDADSTVRYFPDLDKGTTWRTA